MIVEKYLKKGYNEMDLKENGALVGNTQFLEKCPLAIWNEVKELIISFL